MKTLFGTLSYNSGLNFSQLIFAPQDVRPQEILYGLQEGLVSPFRSLVGGHFLILFGLKDHYEDVHGGVFFDARLRMVEGQLLQTTGLFDQRIDSEDGIFSVIGGRHECHKPYELFSFLVNCKLGRIPPHGCQGEVFLEAVLF